MIKRFFLLMSAFLLCAFAKAQIQRNFDGLVLGKATKNEIINYLRRNSFYPDEMYGGKTIIAEGDISFGGVVWNGRAYNLYNGVFYQIIYTKVCRHKSVEIDAFYHRLRNRLLKKYAKNKLPSSNAKIPDKLYIKGKNTTVKIRKYSEGDHNYVKLIYTDIELNKKSKKKDYDDL